MMKESITTTLEPVPVFLQIYLLFGILGVILILVRGIISSYKNVKRTGSSLGGCRRVVSRYLLFKKEMTMPGRRKSLHFILAPQEISRGNNPLRWNSHRLWSGMLRVYTLQREYGKWFDRWIWPAFAFRTLYIQYHTHLYVEHYRLSTPVHPVYTKDRHMSSKRFPRSNNSHFFRPPLHFS